MLLAEIHGHRILEAVNSEDYLTSTIFGHLRYLPPKSFWQDLFEQALAMPGARSRTLAHHLEQLGIKITDFESLDVRFWARHPVHGCPDLVLVFKGSGVQPLIILIEAKLWAEKSGTGEFDQIARYLRLLDDPDAILPRLPGGAVSALIYLTEHDSLAELEESVSVYGNPREARERVFRLQWQDIVVATEEAVHEAAGTEKLILRDVAAFLSQRNLEYFRGFRRLNLPDMEVQKFEMFALSLFTQVPLPSGLLLKELTAQVSRDLFACTPLPAGFTIKRGP